MAGDVVVDQQRAAIDHARALFTETGADDPVALCVFSDGSYGMPDGIITSFPCTTDGKGNWKIVPDFELDDYAKEQIAISTNELLEEREAIKHLLT